MISARRLLNSKRNEMDGRKMMIRKIVSVVISAGIMMGAIFTMSSNAQDQMSSRSGTQVIQEMRTLSADRAFQRLSDADLFYDERSLEGGILQAFAQRREEGVRLAMVQIQQRRKSKDGEGARYFHVAKKILQKFPEESAGLLLNRYKNGDPEIRGNVVRVIAGMPQSEFTQTLLRKALEDHSFCEEDSPEIVGEPLRVCDVAYNEIVAHYSIRNVLRTIGTGHRVEVRDYHIEQLKTRF